MFSKRSAIGRTLLVALPLALVAMIGLGGCFRGHGFSRMTPERLERKMNWIEEDLADDLNIRAEQQAAYSALAERYKAFAREWVARKRAVHEELSVVFEADDPDMDRVAALLKRAVRERHADAEVEALIDATLAFYRTLDADQQEELQGKMARHARH